MPDTEPPCKVPAPPDVALAKEQGPHHALPADPSQQKPLRTFGTAGSMERRRLLLAVLSFCLMASGVNSSDSLPYTQVYAAGVVAQAVGFWGALTHMAHIFDPGFLGAVADLAGSLEQVTAEQGNAKRGASRLSRRPRDEGPKERQKGMLLLASIAFIQWPSIQTALGMPMAEATELAMLRGLSPVLLGALGFGFFLCDAYGIERATTSLRFLTTMWKRVVPERVKKLWRANDAGGT